MPTVAATGDNFFGGSSTETYTTAAPTYSIGGTSYGGGYGGGYGAGTTGYTTSYSTSNAVPVTTTTYETQTAGEGFFGGAPSAIYDSSVAALNTAATTTTTTTNVNAAPVVYKVTEEVTTTTSQVPTTTYVESNYNAQVNNAYVQPEGYIFEEADYVTPTKSSGYLRNCLICLGVLLGLAALGGLLALLLMRVKRVAPVKPVIPTIVPVIAPEVKPTVI